MRRRKLGTSTQARCNHDAFECPRLVVSPLKAHFSSTLKEPTLRLHTSGRWAIAPGSKVRTPPPRRCPATLHEERRRSISG